MRLREAELAARGGGGAYSGADGEAGPDAKKTRVDGAFSGVKAEAGGPGVAAELGAAMVKDEPGAVVRT